MNLIAFFHLVILAVFTARKIQAATDRDQREKRSLGTDSCPENSTVEECDAYAEELSEYVNVCHTFETWDNRIHWQGCGMVFCGENTKLVESDLSMPFPDCCEQCEIIDENKDAYASGIF